MEDMELDKVKSFVYFGAEIYSSRSVLKNAAIALIFVDLLIGVIIYFRNLIAYGICVIIFTLLYILFVLIVCNKKTVKSFQLRFLTTAISGILLAIHFLLYAYIVLNETNNNMLYTILITLSIAVFASLFLSLLIVFSIKKGYFVKAYKIQKSPIFVVINNISLILIPVSGLIGAASTRIMRNHFGINSEAGAYIGGIIFVIVSIGALLASIFRIFQYYYARKFAITCDENGDTTSPGLELPPKIKKKWKSCPINTTSPGLEPPPKVKKNWKSRPIFKVLIVLASIVGAIVGIFIVILIVAFIKGIVSAIIN